MNPEKAIAERIRYLTESYERDKKGTRLHAPVYALIDAINDRYAVEHGQGAQLTLGSTYIIVHVNLKASQWLDDVHPFLELFADAEWTKSTTNNGQSVNHTIRRTTDEGTVTVYVYVYPSNYSENCKRVKVGVEDVYEWRCAGDSEEVSD